MLTHSSRILTGQTSASGKPGHGALADTWKDKRPRREQSARPARLHRPRDRHRTGGDTETARSSARLAPGPGIAVRLPRTRTKTYSCRRTVS